MIAMVSTKRRFLIGSVCLLTISFLVLVWAAVDAKLCQFTAEERCAVIAYHVVRELEKGADLTQLDPYLAFVGEGKRGLFRRDQDGYLIDPWGTRFHLEIREVDRHRELIVSSAGPDRTWGSSDDITYNIGLAATGGTGDSQPPR